MTLYGCPACDGTWVNLHEAAAHCRYSDRDLVVYSCACGQYRHCDLGDFITTHLKYCDQGKAVFDEGFKFENRYYQAVVEKCGSQKDGRLSRPFRPKLIEQEEQTEEDGSLPQMIAPARTLPLPQPPTPSFGAGERPANRRRFGLSTVGAEQSALSHPLSSTASATTSPASMPVPLYSATQSGSASGLLAPPAPPRFSSPNAQHTIRTTSDSASNKNSARQSILASNSIINSQNRESLAKSNRQQTSRLPVDSVDDGHVGQVNTSIRQDREVNSLAASRAVVDGARPTFNTIPARERSSPAQSSQAAHVSRAAPNSGITAEDLANAMPPSRYGPLGMPRKVEGKKKKKMEEDE